MRYPITRSRVAPPVILALGALAASCSSVGPDYRRPALDVPVAYKSAATQPAATQPAPGPRLALDWWRLFGDPGLTTLAQEALKTNQDLKAAVARVTQARAASAAVKSQFYPIVTFDPSLIRSRTPGTTGGPASTANNVTIPFDLTYEVDIWGRVRRSVEGAEAQTQFALDDYEVVRQTLLADLAQDYFTLRSLDDQERIFVRNIDLYQRQLALVQKQLKAGLAAQIDVLQARTLLDSTLAQETDIRRQRADMEHALAILVGRPPSELTLPERPLDFTPPVIPVGLPSDLLRRRPDVAEAEQSLIAAGAQVGVAVANFYPTVTLTGSAGFESISVQHALDWESRLWSLGPSVTIPIFQGGALNANLVQAKARYQELEADYRGAVLGAFHDVEDSLTDLHLRADAAAALDRAVASSREQLHLAEVQYQQGLTNYLQVIDADRTLLTNELSAAQILEQRMISTVLLIKALGGGWSAPLPPTTQPER